MKIAVIRFPGSNCDQDAYYSLRNDVGIDAEYVWYESTSLAGFEAVFVPGGFSYGDYLRCGAIAAQSPIMTEIKRLANQGMPVIGVCNGFQILCEAGLLPGALLLNSQMKFLCQNVFLRAESRDSSWTEDVDRIIKLPIAHGEGRYICDPNELKIMESLGQIAFRYCNSNGELTADSNPNGSVKNIAGVMNKGKNILGLMPHPERATSSILGSSDGLFILNSLAKVNSTSL